MIYNNNASGGLIKLILVIIVVLLVLAYFGFNLRSIVNSPTFQDNWDLIKEFLSSIWNNYLKKPFTYVIDLFVRLIGKPAIDNLEKLQAGEPASADLVPRTRAEREPIR